MVNKNIILTLFLAFSLCSFRCSRDLETNNVNSQELSGVYLLESYLLDLQMGASHVEALKNFSFIPYQQGIERPIIMAIHNGLITIRDDLSSSYFEIETIEGNSIITKNISDGYGSRRFQITDNGIILNGDVRLVKISDYKTDIVYNSEDIPWLTIDQSTYNVALSYILKVILMDSCYNNKNGDTLYQSESGKILYKNSEYFLHFSDSDRGREISNDLAIETDEEAGARAEREGRFSRKSFYFKIENDTCYIYQREDSLTGSDFWDKDIVYIEVDRLEKIGTVNNKQNNRSAALRLKRRPQDKIDSPEKRGKIHVILDIFRGLKE
jgi:hypothetical protein